MIKCALFLSLVLFGVGCKCPTASTGPAPMAAGGAPAAPPHFTEISYKCSSDTYILTSGSAVGECSTTADADGNITGGSCDDKKGNAASATCVSKAYPGEEGGTYQIGRCVQTSGTGNCIAQSAY